MSGDFDEADIAAMHREGDLKQFLRDQIRAGRSRRDKPAVVAPPPSPPGHRPGAWPTGTSPPGPVVQRHSPAEWAAALDEYRVWLTTPNHTTGDQICGCAACQLTDQTEENQ